MSSDEDGASADRAAVNHDASYGTDVVANKLGSEYEASQQSKPDIVVTDSTGSVNVTAPETSPSLPPVPSPPHSERENEHAVTETAQFETGQNRQNTDVTPMEMGNDTGAGSMAEDRGTDEDERSADPLYPIDQELGRVQMMDSTTVEGGGEGSEGVENGARESETPSPEESERSMDVTASMALERKAKGFIEKVEGLERLDSISILEMSTQKPTAAAEMPAGGAEPCLQSEENQKGDDGGQKSNQNRDHHQSEEQQKGSHHENYEHQQNGVSDVVEGSEQKEGVAQAGQPELDSGGGNQVDDDDFWFETSQLLGKIGYMRIGTLTAPVSLGSGSGVSGGCQYVCYTVMFQSHTRHLHAPQPTYTHTHTCTHLSIHTCTVYTTYNTRSYSSLPIDTSHAHTHMHTHNTHTHPSSTHNDISLSHSHTHSHHLPTPCSHTNLSAGLSKGSCCRLLQKSCQHSL